MLWVTQGASGRVGFVMNRAYDLGRSDAVFCLLEAEGYCWPDAQHQAFRYVRATDAAPIVVMRDPKRGVVYHAHWRSAPQTGSARMTDTRHIFLLCDERRRWRVLGEGPITAVAANGADEVNEQSVEAHATWTADPSHPVDLDFTLLATKRWSLSGAGRDNSPQQSLTTRWDMIPGQPESNGLIDGLDPHDEVPGAFKPKRPPYILAGQSESLKTLTARLAHCCRDFPVNHDDRSKQEFVAGLEAALRKKNPDLGSTLRQGQKIVLSSEIRLWYEP